jgi:mitotic spindle assembly checkpoint protein MAD2
MVKKYGLPMLITADEELKGYLETILKQVHGEINVAFSVLV